MNAGETIPSSNDSHGSAKIRHDSCRVESPTVALTFDDGPHATLTPALLDILETRGVRATFFVIGKACVESPGLLRRELAEGHEIGNHTWSHPRLTKLPTDDLLSELQRTTDIIHTVTGRGPVVMRPPYLDTNAGMEQFIGERCGMKVIGASVDSLDWRDHDANLTAEHIFAGVAPGSIILCHETQPTTIEAMPKVLDALLARGFKFVTVSELIAMDKSDPVSPLGASITTAR